MRRPAGAKTGRPMEFKRNRYTWNLARRGQTAFARYHDGAGPIRTQTNFRATKDFVARCASSAIQHDISTSLTASKARNPAGRCGGRCSRPMAAARGLRHSNRRESRADDRRCGRASECRCDAGPHRRRSPRQALKFRKEPSAGNRRAKEADLRWLASSRADVPKSLPAIPAARPLNLWRANGLPPLFKTSAPPTGPTAADESVRMSSLDEKRSKPRTPNGRRATSVNSLGTQSSAVCKNQSRHIAGAAAVSAAKCVQWSAINNSNGLATWCGSSTISMPPGRSFVTSCFK